MVAGCESFLCSAGYLNCGEYCVASGVESIDADKALTIDGAFSVLSIVGGRGIAAG